MASYFHASPMVCPLLPDRVSIGKLPRPRSIRGKFHRASALINFKFITCNYLSIIFLFPFGYFRFAYCYTLITEFQGIRLFLSYLVANNNGFSRRQLWVGCVATEPLVTPISKLFI